MVRNRKNDQKWAFSPFEMTIERHYCVSSRLFGSRDGALGIQ